MLAAKGGTMLLRTSSFVWLAVTATAQLNLLTPREAIQVFAMIPEIAKAKKEGFCPRFEARYGDEASNLGVQVRYGCGPYAGALIGNYGVDLWTGAVHQGESKKRISNPEGQALAKTLLQAAASRILSENEARCLALAAARSLPDWDPEGNNPTRKLT